MGTIKRVLGIDVGLSSASAAIFGHDGSASNFPKVLAVLDVPTVGEDAGKRIDVRAFWAWIGQHDPDIGYIENATAMPGLPDPKTGQRRGMGAGTMARYMRACGALETCVALAGVDGVLVMPGQWKKRMGLVGPKKGQSIALAKALCPESVQWLPTKTRKGVVSDVAKYHNRAEGILIAVYGAMRCDMIDLKVT